MSDTIEKGPVKYLLRSFIYRYKRLFSAGVALLFAGLILSRIPPLVIGIALDSLLLETAAFQLPVIPDAFVPNSTTAQAAIVFSTLGMAILGEVVAKWYGRLTYEKASLETLHDVRTAAFTVATDLSIEADSEEIESQDERLSVIHEDVNNIIRLFNGGRDVVLYGGNIVSAFIFMAILNWNLAVILLILPVAIIVTGRVYARLLSPRYDRLRVSVGSLNTKLRDAITGQATVKVYNREETESDRIRNSSEEYRDAKWSAIRLRAIYNRVSWLIAAVGIWGVFAFGSYWILAGPLGVFTQSLTPGALLAFILYTFSFLDPTRRIAVNVFDAIEDGRASARRIVRLLSSGSKTADGSKGPELNVTQGAVSYDGISYQYPSEDEFAVRDTSFDLPGSGYIGVVGPSGAGKSTLLSLLFRFRTPSSGSIKIDGQDIGNVGLSSLRSHLGYVSQDPSLFPGTIEENIAYAQSEPDMAAVRDAARKAGAHEFIQRMDEGYDTRVGEHGATLSGGQKQRIAIARALFPNPEVLVLDEATSHVDNQTGVKIQKQLLEIADDELVISITHRIPTVRHADRILVLDDGELVEEGVHDELIQNNQTYAQIWRVQVGETEPNASQLGSEV